MAEEVIIIDVELKGADADAKVDELRKSIVELEEANKRLRKEQNAVKGTTTADMAEKKKLGVQVQKNQQQLKGLKKEVQDNIKVNKLQAGSIAKLREENKKLRAARDSLDVSTKKGQKSAAALNKEIDKNNKTIKKNSDALTKQKMGIGSYTKSILSAAGLGSAVAALTMGFRALSKAITQSTSDFAEFETGQSNVQALLEEYDEELKGKTLGLMKQYGLELADVNKALFDAVSAGVDSANATEFLGEAARLSIAGVTDLSTATDALTTIINSYGLNLSEAGKVADSFFSAQKFGKTTVAELAQNIGTVAPIANTAGIAYEELLAVFAELTKQGINTAESATAIKSTITALINPSKDAEEAMSAYGIETGIAAIKQNGLFETLVNVAEVTATNEDALTDFIPNVRALVGVSALGTENLAEYSDILKTIQTDTGDASSATKAFADQMDNVAKITDVVNAELKAQSIEIGEKTAPLVIGLKKAWLGIKKGFVEQFIPSIKQANEALGEQSNVTVQDTAKIEENTKAVEKNAVVRYKRLAAVKDISAEIAEQEKETLAMFAEADAELFAKVDEMINEMAEETAEATADLNKEQLSQIAEQIEAEKAASAEKIRIAEAEAEAKYAAFSGLSASLASLFGEETKLGKAAAVIATTINTYRGAQAAFAQTPGGIIVKSAAAAAAIASGLANLKQIRSTPTMAEGGVIDGPSHAQGGITLLRSDTMTPVAEVEGRESLYVVNKRDTPLIDRLNAVNSIHGKPFGSTRYAADGGEINTTIDTSGISTALIEAVSRLQIFVKVRDIIEGTGNYVNVVQSAEV